MKRRLLIEIELEATVDVPYTSRSISISGSTFLQRLRADPEHLLSFCQLQRTFHPKPLHCFLISNRTYPLSLYSPCCLFFLLVTAASLPHHCTITVKPVDQLFPCGFGLPASFERCCYTWTTSTQTYTTAGIHQHTPTVLLTAWCVPLCATVNFTHTVMCLVCTYTSQHGVDN